MFCAFVSSNWSLLILLLFVNSQQTFAKPAKRLADAASVPNQTQHCNNVYFYEARFKRRATAVPNSIDRIKLDFSLAVASLPRRRF